MEAKYTHLLEVHETCYYWGSCLLMLERKQVGCHALISTTAKYQYCSKNDQ